MFTDEQQALWDRVVARLDREGLARKADEDRLASYVYSEWTVRDCIRRINESGLLVRAANGEPKANPLLAVQARADRTATRLAREFGLTPASRSRLLPRLPEASLTQPRSVTSGNLVYPPSGQTRERQVAWPVDDREEHAVADTESESPNPLSVGGTVRLSPESFDDASFDVEWFVEGPVRISSDDLVSLRDIKSGAVEATIGPWRLRIQVRQVADDD